jgi:hypothetical protein
MSWIDAVGFAAASAVLASFCMTTIVPLRLLAILSNMLFGLYGVSAHLYPVFLLHSILLPINLFKLARGASQTDRPRKSGPPPFEHSERGAPGEFDWVEKLTVDELRLLAKGELDIDSYRQTQPSRAVRPAYLGLGIGPPSAAIANAIESAYVKLQEERRGITAHPRASFVLSNPSGSR